MKNQTPWRLAKRATLIDAKEATFVHKRPAVKNDRLSTPVGCIVRAIGETGEPVGWQAYVFTDNTRRRAYNGTNWEKVGGVVRGVGSKARCAASVWDARRIVPVMPDPLERQPRSTYGCGRDTRTYRGQA